MRTQGTFEDVYRAARSHCMELEDCNILEPVVRRVGDVWMLESGLEPEPDADVDVTIDSFELWFYDAFKDTGYVPSESDVSEFVKEHTYTRI